jgi:peptidoglycan/LPS O-acetylase OafA/YrhL
VGVLIYYVLILVAAILPLLYRQAYGVRLLSVVILCIAALLHFTYLMASHRLVMEDGTRESAVAPGGELAPDLRVAVASVQKYNQQQMWPFAALTAALVLLALLPFESMKGPAPPDGN